jgi:anti-sigma regulatory factor (Ser/Thr protein kinase)
VLRPILQGCPGAYEALLCASELATNALLHSDTREAGGTFTVRAEIRPGTSVTIEVEDCGGCWAEPRPHPAHGRGLGIVQQLTDDWGVRDNGKRRVVWRGLAGQLA